MKAGTIWCARPRPTTDSRGQYNYVMSLETGDQVDGRVVAVLPTSPTTSSNASKL
jgi:hypothetical protein